MNQNQPLLLPLCLLPIPTDRQRAAMFCLLICTIHSIPFKVPCPIFVQFRAAAAHCKVPLFFFFLLLLLDSTKTRPVHNTSTSHNSSSSSSFHQHRPSTRVLQSQQPPPMTAKQITFLGTFNSFSSSKVLDRPQSPCFVGGLDLQGKWSRYEIYSCPPIQSVSRYSSNRK